MSAPTKLIKQNQADSQQVTPWASVGFFSFTYPDTFTLKKSLQTVNSAISTFRTLVVSDPISVITSNSKGAVENTAEVVLSSGDINYAYRLSPGDWAFIWMHDDVTHFDRVNNAVLAGTAANDAKSGLKFIGRVFSVREINVIQGGIKTLRYSISLRGFTEFESQIYYNPMLSAADDEPLKFLAKLSDEWNNILGTANGATPVDKLLTFFIDLFFGKGPKQTANKPFPGLLRSPNVAFIIPKEVAHIMGVRKSEKQNASYTDLLKVLIGVQKYTTPNSFFPGRLDTLIGAMISVPNNFNNVTVWSLLQAHLNQTLNEMYVTLRQDENGNIFPYYVARQQPFTSKRYKGTVGTTPFLTVPRWKIDPTRQFAAYNLGTTNAVRCNFLQVYGQMYNRPDPQAAMREQIVSGNYAVDTLDAYRSGSRNFILTSNHDVQLSDGTALSSISDWKDLLADWYMNLHLKANGTITVTGITEPICVGDNLEYEGMVYQIEGIQHQYSVDDSGPRPVKSFITTLSLSHGVTTTGDYLYTLGDDRQKFGSSYWPAVSDEELYVNNRPIVGVENAKQDKQDE